MLRIIEDRNVSIDDLVWLREKGMPVSMTSHPGNASLYKLSLWSAGIPEMLWDITCVIADTNNQPAHMLKGGGATPLISNERRAMYRENAKNGTRQITAYTRMEDGRYLGRVHTSAMMRLFPETITTQSALLNRYTKELRPVCEYLADTIPERMFQRYIFPCGATVALFPDKNRRTFTANAGDMSMHIARGDIATSFANVLSELETLLTRDCVGALSGGACYRGSAYAHALATLAHYWKTGECLEYDISGPDMIHYAMSEEYRATLSGILEHVRLQFPALVPKHTVIRMVPGTAARVGCVKGHISEEIMEERLALLSQQTNGEEKKMLREHARERHTLWPIQIHPAEDPYFSQHDLGEIGGAMFVPERFRMMSFGDMETELVRLKNILRV